MSGRRRKKGGRRGRQIWTPLLVTPSDRAPSAAFSVRESEQLPSHQGDWAGQLIFGFSMLDFFAVNFYIKWI